MRGHSSRLRRGSAFVVAAVIVACTMGAIAGASGCGTFGSGADGTADGGTDPDAASPDGCAAGSCLPADLCKDKVVYVSPNGNDGEPGCDRARPKRTLGGAVSTLGLSGHADFEIHACKGDYRENGLVLKSPVALRGGYDCGQWVRGDSFGFPTFDTASESVLSVIEGGTAAATVTVDAFPAVVSGKVVVDGFRIRGPARPATSDAVVVRAGAFAALTNDVILGAATGGTTRGVHLLGRSTTEIANNVIAGGGGTAGDPRDVGSAGVVGEAPGPVKIHDNAIDGGTGKAASNVGSAGIVIAGGPTDPAASIKSNAINAGKGVGFGVPAFGLFVAGVPVEIEGNFIHGGDGSCTSPSCATTAIHIEGVSALRFLGNRVYGGDLPDGAGARSFCGVALVGTVSAEVLDNFVHAGNARKIAANVASNAAAVRVVKGRDARIIHNTIVAGPSLPKRGVTAIDFSDAHELAIVQNNLLVGLRGDNETGISATCPAPLSTIKSLTNNAFFDLPVLAVGVDRLLATCSPEGKTALGTLVTFANIASDNVRVGADCGGEASCVAPFECSASGQSCRALTFKDFDESTAGGANFVGLGPSSSNGLPLATTASCLIALGGVVSSVTKDFYGTPRMTPPSIGAHEQRTCR